MSGSAACPPPKASRLMRTQRVNRSRIMITLLLRRAATRDGMRGRTSEGGSESEEHGGEACDERAAYAACEDPMAIVVLTSLYIPPPKPTTNPVHGSRPDA